MEHQRFSMAAKAYELVKKHTKSKVVCLSWDAFSSLAAEDIHRQRVYL